jgi:hypothetical protein
VDNRDRFPVRGEERQNRYNPTFFIATTLRKENIHDIDQRERELSEMRENKGDK